MKRLFAFLAAAAVLSAMACIDFEGAANERCATSSTIAGCAPVVDGGAADSGSGGGAGGGGGDPVGGGGGGGAGGGGGGRLSADAGGADAGADDGGTSASDGGVLGDGGVWDGGWWELPWAPFPCAGTNGLPDGGSSEFATWVYSVDAGIVTDNGTYDFGPTVSADGRKFCWARSVPTDINGPEDLLCAERASPTAPAAQPFIMQAALNTAADEMWPELSPDGRVLLFARSTGGTGVFTDPHQLYAAYSWDGGLEFTDEIPVFGAPSGSVRGTRFSCDGRRLYVVYAASGTSFAAYSFDVTGKARIGNGALEAGISTSTDITEMSVAPDGRTAITTTRGGNGTPGSWFPTRFTRSGTGWGGKAAMPTSWNAAHGFDFDQSYVVAGCFQSGSYDLFYMPPQ